MSNRTARFTAGIVTGYAAVIVNILYTLLSVRLALHYLGKTEFGLWAIALQVSGYLLLLDFGISTSMSRFVADHKDQVNGGEYGGILRIGFIVFTLQGLVVATAGALFSIIASRFLGVPGAFHQEFTNILLIITLTSGFSVATRSIAVPLWAFQRMDVNNISSIVSLATNITLLWVGFRAGWGIYSFAYAGIPGAILSPLYCYWICQREGYYPSAECWGHPQWKVFRNMFSFGKDALLISLGSQLVNASQLMILGRLIGLDAAAIFSVGTKFYAMGQMVVAKILESSAPGLTELYVRGDEKLFARRFRDIVSMTAAVAAAAGAALLVGNRELVGFWTHGAILWPTVGDWLLAPLLLFTSLSRCFVGLLGITKNLRPVRYLYFLEGVVFVILCFLFVKKFGIVGMLLSSLAAHLCVTSVLSILASRRIISEHYTIRAYLGGLAVIIISGGIIGFLLPNQHGLIVTLSYCGLIGLTSIIFALFVIFDVRLRDDLMAWTLKPFR